MKQVNLYSLKVGDIFIAQDSYGSGVYRMVRTERPTKDRSFSLIVGADFNGEESTFGYSEGNSHYCDDIYLVGHLELHR